MSETKISIPLQEYQQLQDDSIMLNALRSAGVNDWEGWDFALEEYWSVVGKDNE